jgi:hypothetical protein
LAPRDGKSSAATRTNHIFQQPGTQGIPESAIIGLIPDKYIQPPSPFRTIAELAASVTWLLRVHQSMQWVQQMPNGLMTVQRLVCPAASEMGGLAAPDGVLAIDWQCIDQVVAAAPPPISDAMNGSPKSRPGHVRHRVNSFLRCVR